jgi:hypothetical protein
MSNTPITAEILAIQSNAPISDFISPDLVNTPENN